MSEYVAVGNDGSVCVTTGMSEARSMRFGPDGRRIDSSKAGTCVSADRERHFKPGRDDWWEVNWSELRLVGKDGKCVLAIKRRPDRHWLGRMGPAGVAPDGAVAVCSFDAEGDCGSYDDPAVNLYTAEGDPIRKISLPPSGYIHKVAYNGRWILLSYSGGLLVLDSEGKSIRKFVPPNWKEGSYWEPFFSPDGKELWLHESTSLTVERYQEPSMESTSRPAALTSQPDNR